MIHLFYLLILLDRIIVVYYILNIIKKKSIITLLYKIDKIKIKNITFNTICLIK